MAEDARFRAAQDRLFADRYRLGAVLGRGAMADVVRAEDQVLGRSVAVKIFRHGEPVDTVERIDAEIRTLASLSHPGLVTLYDAGTAPDATGIPSPYLVMELIDGPTLNSFRQNRAMHAVHVARIGSELAEALAYIQDRGVVHRDIKPANILIAHAPDSGAGQCAKLADFGIARIVDSDRLTEHGTTVGTAHYLSPEQATGTSAGPPTDIYTLGLVLIECLTGTMVFEGSAVAAAVARLHRDPAVPQELGPEWHSLLTAMTSRQPEDRPDAAAVAHRLRRILRSATPLPPTAVIPVERTHVVAAADPVGTAHRPPRRRWMVPGAAAALVLALGAGIIWIASSASDDPGQVPATPATPTPIPYESTIAVPTTQVTEPPVATVPNPTDAEVTPSSNPVLIQPAAPAAPQQNESPGTNNGNGNGNSGSGNGGPGNSGNGNSGPGNSSSGPGNPGNGNSGPGNPGRGN
ncbi:serine/threonine protein kinase [Rhodococcoides fascians A25f]|uniref:serine/threonine-protein kinase n=1 Tax=Rhodococcoides fascians TaxID=1828 RepID=UPI00055DC220|nr:serine/threonine-protein kinase [Rhodococcus fascians]QII06169.1 serine/threonine protein kinase [Rhodococcus fascians A25f]